MKITHDKIADAIYFSLKKGPISHTIKLDDRLLVDTNKKGQILGIEILNASTQIANKKPIQANLKIPALA
ncbi:MAG: DUF2283 domain-containing protein [Candidatus Pacebacteria bacterium]|nr:DUF2283 domain-containing protein [Candidatus Paceibacterota bacterium]